MRAALVDQIIDVPLTRVRVSGCAGQALTVPGVQNTATAVRPVTSTAGVLPPSGLVDQHRRADRGRVGGG